MATVRRRTCLHLLSSLPWVSVAGFAAAAEVPASRKIVISGFRPFAGRAVNASSKLAEMIAAHAARPQVSAITVPVVWGAPGKEVEKHWPGPGGLWVAFGEGHAGGLRIETRARNRRGKLPDEDRKPPEREYIIPGGTNVLEQPFPTQELAAALEKAGFPTTLSDDAGRYLCEEMFYELLSRRRAGEQAGEAPATVLFIHLPPWGTRLDETQLADEVWFQKLAAVVLRLIHEARPARPSSE